MLCEQITRFTKSEIMGIVTELRSTCVKLGCRVKNKKTKIRKMLNLKSYIKTEDKGEKESI